MSAAHKSGGKGTYLLDRVFPGVGRVRRATGTRDRNMATALNSMLTSLWAAGRSDVLAEIRDKRLHPMEVWRRFRIDGAAGLPAPEKMRPLSELTVWAESLDASKRHRQNVQSGVRVFLRSADGSLTDLPDLLRTYKRRTGKRMFNVVRSALQAFARDTFGKHSALWSAITGVPPWKYKPKKGHPLTPEQLSRVKLTQPYMAMAWAMASTGMGPAEYWGSWEVLRDRIAIHGTKREGRERVVPRVGEPVVPACTYKKFLTEFKTATKGRHLPYDLRRSYANWLEAAMIPRTRRRQYMGHSTGDVTADYEWHEVDDYLRDDAARLAAYIGDAPKRLLALG
jgi:integrase